MPSSRSPIRLPSPLQRRLENAVGGFLDAGMACDFARPPGEPALLAPDSVSWRVFKNPLTLFIGGVAAVVLELAEPRVRTGVWEHTSFRRDPLPRLKRTGMAAMMTVYAPRGQAKAMIAGVTRLHARIEGATPDGRPYRADDPALLDWVHATAAFGFLEAYAAYVRPLAAPSRDAYYREGQAAAALYGATGAPTSQHELDALFETMRGDLEASPIVFDFLRMMQGVPLLPAGMRPFQRCCIRAAVALVPPAVRSRLGLGAEWNLAPWQRTLVRYAAGAADRIVVRSAPAVQSCLRLGLPDDYLYGARSTK